MGKEVEPVTKTEKELLLDEIKGLIADSTKGVVKAEDLEKRVEAINKSITEKLDGFETKEERDAAAKELKDNVDKLLTATAENAAAIKALTEQGKKDIKDNPKSFKDALIAAVMEKSSEVPGLLSDRNDDFGQRKSLKDYFVSKGNKHSPEFVIKVAVDMLESNIVQSNVATVRLAELDPQRVGIPLTIYPHVTDWMPSKTIQRPTMSILVVYTYEDGSGTKTEGSASSKSSFLLKTVEFKSFFIATYFTLSDETLDDLNEAMEEIAVTGPSKILDNVDSQILGSAGDDSTAIAGLLSANKKTDFAATWDGTIPDANMVDLLATMKLQCEGNKYMPDAVLLSPTDVSKLGAKKDQLDNSINDRRVAFSLFGEPVMICGMRIIKSTAITANTAVVLDSKQLMIGKRKDMTMEIGYNAADFTEGQKTLVIKIRVAFGVRDKAAVIYSSDIDADVTAITVT